MFYVRALHVLEVLSVIGGSLAGVLIVLLDARAGVGMTPIGLLGGAYFLLGGVVSCVVFGASAEVVKAVLSIERSLTDRAEAVSHLPARVADLLHEIETWSGVSIDFRANTDPPDPDDPYPEAPATSFSHEGATILLRRVDSDPHGTLHELLH